VEHEGFEDLDGAIAAMRRSAERVQAEGPLQGTSALRDFAPEDQVHARLQISGKGLLRKPTAGVDVKGDGSLVAFRGTVMREELEPEEQGTPFDAVRETLAEKAR
jgi:hypothetical protein